jgi:hypothetical protein
VLTFVEYSGNFIEFVRAPSQQGLNVRRHDTQHDDIPYNDTQHKEIIRDTQHCDIQHYNTQHKGLICDI